MSSASYATLYTFQIKHKTTEEEIIKAVEDERNIYVNSALKGEEKQSENVCDAKKFWPLETVERDAMQETNPPRF